MMLVIPDNATVHVVMQGDLTQADRQSALPAGEGLAHSAVRLGWDATRTPVVPPARSHRLLQVALAAALLVGGYEAGAYVGRTDHPVGIAARANPVPRAVPGPAAASEEDAGAAVAAQLASPPKLVPPPGPPPSRAHAPDPFGLGN